MKQFIKKYNGIIKLILCFIIFFFSSYLLLIPLSILNIDYMKDERTYYIVTFAANVLRAILLFLLYRKDLIKDFKKLKGKFWEYSDIAIKYWLIGLLVMVVSNVAIMIFTPAKMADNETTVRTIIKTIPYLSIILTGITAPLSEEIIFRKSFKNVINDKITYILISGVVFGAMHVVSSYDSLFDLLYIIPYSSLGVAFAATCYKTDNIFPSMVVHAIHNTAITVATIFAMSGIML